MKNKLVEIENNDRLWHNDHYSKKVQHRGYPTADTIERYKKVNHWKRYRVEWQFFKLKGLANEAPVILDFACGDGNLTFLLLECLRPAKVYGFDLSEKLISIAKKNASASGRATDIEFLCSSFTALPYAKGSFDIVHINHVLHHFPDYAAQAIQVANELLKPNGYLIVSEPICDSRLFAFVRKLLPIEKDVTPDEIQFKSQDLIQLVKKHFYIRDFKYFELFSKFSPYIKNNAFSKALYTLDEWVLNFKFMKHFGGDLAIFAQKK